MIRYNLNKDITNRTPVVFNEESDEFKICNLIKNRNCELASQLMLGLDCDRLTILNYFIFDYIDKDIYFKYEDKYEDKIILISIIKNKSTINLTIGDSNIILINSNAKFVNEYDSFNNMYNNLLKSN